jgi:hypothetical protein
VVTPERQTQSAASRLLGPAILVREARTPAQVLLAKARNHRRKELLPGRERRWERPVPDLIDGRTREPATLEIEQGTVVEIELFKQEGNDGVAIGKGDARPAGDLHDGRVVRGRTATE